MVDELVAAVELVGAVLLVAELMVEQSGAVELKAEYKVVD